MIDYGGLITLGAGLIGGATAPKRPDIAPYNPELLEDRSIDDYAPELKSLVDSQSDIASSLLKGELPQGVVDQIKMFAGEAAQRGGFGASVTRSGNLAARDIGLTALDAMAQGQQYAGFVQNYAREKLNLDLAIETSNANMLYDQWASQAEGAMASYNDSLGRHNQMWGAVASGGADFFTAYGDNKNEAAANALYDTRTQKGRDFEMKQTEMIIAAMKPA